MAVDSTRCPDCAEQLRPGTTRCPGCGLLLRGPLALRLWQVSNDLELLTAARAELLAALRPGGSANPAPDAEAPTPAARAVAGLHAAAPPPAPAQAAPAPAAPAPAAPAEAAPAAAAPDLAAAYGFQRTAPSPTPPPPARRSAWEPPTPAEPRRAPAAPPRPRREWTPQRVQNLLLLTGTFLLVVAAVVFTAFTWGRLPIPARGAIMLAVTAATAWSARWVHRRGLTASAEAIGLLTVLFAGVDLYAAHAANLAGLGGTDPATYASIASGVLALFAVGFARVVPVRSVRYAALVAAQAPLAITALRVDAPTLAHRAVPFAAQAALLGAAAYRLSGLALAARVSAAGNWALAALLALSTAYAGTSLADVRPAALVLALTGAVALLWPGERAVTAGVATAFGLLAVVAPARLTLTDVQLPAVVAAAGLAAVVAAAAFDRAWRDGPLLVGSVAVGLAVAAVGPWVAQALGLPLSWPAEPWTVTGDAAARHVLSAHGHRWGGSVVTLGVVVVGALTAVLVAEVLGRRAAARWPVVVLTSAAVLLVPLGLDRSLYAALAWYVVAGAAGLAASAATRSVTVGISASVVLAVATAWSFAGEGPTLAVLLAVTVAYAAWAAAYATVREPAAAVAAAGCAAFAVALSAARGAPVERTGFVWAATSFALTAAAALLAGRVRSVEGVACLAYAVSLGLVAGDVGWAAWTLGCGAVTAAVVATRPARRWLAGVAAVLAAACSAATAAAFGLEPALVGLALAGTACALGAAGVLLRLRDVQGVAAAAYVAGTAVTVPDLRWLSYALAAGAVTSALLATRERVLAPVAAALAVACSGTTAYALGAPLDRTGFVVAVAAAAALAVGTLLREAYGQEVELVAAAGYVVGLALAGGDLGWASWTLAVGATATGLAALRTERRFLAGVSAALAAVCSGATAGAFGLAQPRIGLVLALTAAALFAVGARLRLADVRGVAAATYAAAALAAGIDPESFAWVLAVGAVTTAITAVADRRFAPAAAALGVSCAGMTAHALGAPIDRTGFVVALAAVAAFAVGALLGGEHGTQVDAVGVTGFVVALVLAGNDPGWLSWVLLVEGLTALAEGLRPEWRVPANWAAVVLLTAWSWDRLWLEDVRMPEAYAAPVAALLLVLGHQRRRRDPDTGSWTAYGRGLGVAFAPTTYLVLTDPGVTRPVLLAIAGTAVLLAGVKERLQAPLTIGAAALAVDGIVQLAPVAVALPKWATIGAVGLLVIVIGVTYEDRRRDVAKLRDEFESLA